MDELTHEQKRVARAMLSNICEVLGCAAQMADRGGDIFDGTDLGPPFDKVAMSLREFKHSDANIRDLIAAAS